MSALEKGYQYGAVSKDDDDEGEESPLVTKGEQRAEEIDISFVDDKGKEEQMEMHTSFESNQEEQEEKVEGISFGRQLLGEVVGTCILTQMGCAGICANTYLGLFHGIFQVAAIWFMAVMLAVSTTASISGAHLNPAVTLAFGMLRPDQFHFAKIIPYWIAQIFGATVAGLINYQIFSMSIENFETKNEITRGDSTGIQSAGAFGCYWTDSVRDSRQAFYIEGFGTSFLVLMVLSCTHPKNKIVPSWGVPIVVGAAVSVCVATLGGLTGAGINPARDLGPRLITYYYGWGKFSFQGAWVYFVAPLAGGVVGGMISDIILY